MRYYLLFICLFFCMKNSAQTHDSISVFLGVQYGPNLRTYDNSFRHNIGFYIGRSLLLCKTGTRLFFELEVSTGVDFFTSKSRNEYFVQPFFLNLALTGRDREVPVAASLLPVKIGPRFSVADGRCVFMASFAPIAIEYSNITLKLFEYSFPLNYSIRKEFDTTFLLIGYRF